MTTTIKAIIVIGIAISGIAFKEHNIAMCLLTACIAATLWEIALMIEKNTKR